MKIWHSLIFLLGATLLTTCQKSTEPEPATVDFTLHFRHVVDGQPLQLDQLIYKNALGQEYSIKTVKYFVSRFQLHKADNTIIELPGIHYVDIRLPETLSYTFAQKIPQGDYTGISFVHGLVPEDNISGRFSEPPESLMEWPEPMGGGYHYMKLEGEYRTPNEDNFFNFHAGLLDGKAYEVHIDLTNQPFTVASDQLDIALEMEIQQWFTDPVDWDFTYFGPAIMGNHEAQATIQQNGQNVYSFAVAEQNP